MAKLDKSGTKPCLINGAHSLTESHLNEDQLQGCCEDLNTNIMNSPCLTRAHTLTHAYIIPEGDTLRKKHIPLWAVWLDSGRGSWGVVGCFYRNHMFQGWLVTAEYLLT